MSGEMEIRLPQIRSKEALTTLIGQLGFLPFFANEIRGFSVEECTPPELWFSDSADGPWEWKGPVARTNTCIYGKLFGNKAGFVSREWVPAFCAWRRSGLGFEDLYTSQLASAKDKRVYEHIRAQRAIETGQLKTDLDFRRGGSTGFDAIITRLQMQTYVVIGDFIYHLDKHMRPYGWGVSLYTTPEAIFGYDEVTSEYDTEPEEIRQRMLSHLKRLLPRTPEAKLDRLIRG